jgi:DNA-binding MarR family transcriptional regulator
MHRLTIYSCIRSVKAYLLVMAGDQAARQQGDRADLAAMVTSLSRALIAAELPVLRAHDLSMWGYVVLTALATGPMRTQAALARAIGADKTRIIGVLDDLQQRGLIQRHPDATDRRVRLLALTSTGRQVFGAARAAIRRQEDQLLAQLPAEDRRGFLDALRILSAEPDPTDPGR